MADYIPVFIQLFSLERYEKNNLPEVFLVKLIRWFETIFFYIRIFKGTLELEVMFGNCEVVTFLVVIVAKPRLLKTLCG